MRGISVASNPSPMMVTRPKPNGGFPFGRTPAPPLGRAPACFVAARRTHAAAAAHAGWRGLAARVPLVAIERIHRDLGSRVDDLMVAIGPAIGACCYEVGEDVRARFAHAGFTPAQIDRWFPAEPAT